MRPAGDIWPMGNNQPIRHLNVDREFQLKFKFALQANNPSMDFLAKRKVKYMP